MAIQEAFLFTKRVSELLQETAGDGRKDAIKALLFLHSRVQSALLMDDADESKDALVQAGNEAMRKSSILHGASPLSPSQVTEMALQVEHSRKSLLEQDLASLVDQEGLTDVKLLSLVIMSLRQREGDILLHQQLAREVQHVVEVTSYEDTNFALGSTPFASFLILMNHPSLSHALSNKGRAMVWGSSIGWLAFFLFASGFSEVAGVEILSTFHQVAVDVKARVSAEGNGCDMLDFLCMDLLDSDLNGVDLLLMTDWCWDEELVTKAAGKIASELKKGAIVISYRGLDQHSGLQLLAQVTAPVSWNPRQKFMVYSKSSSNV
jgi:hypothetical protein